MSDDKLDKLMNPSWLNEVQKMQKRYELINGLDHQGIAISNIQREMETLNQSLSVQESKWLASATELAEKSSRILQSIEQPEWMKAINRFEEFSRHALLAFENSGIHNKLLENAERLKNSFQEPGLTKVLQQNNQLLKVSEQLDWMKSIERFDKIHLQAMKAFTQHESLYSRLIESARVASKHYHLEAFDSIANLQNSPLNHFAELALEPFFETIYSDDIHDLDKDINTEIGRVDDFESLPSNTQSKIVQYLKLVFLTIFLNLLSNYLYDQREHLAQSLKALTEPSEVKSFTRKGLSKYDREVLSGLRVVSGNNVNLRTEPSLKSDIILQLNTGQLLEVLDKTNRAWLFVEVSDGEDVIQGWIARRYTLYFK